MGLEATTYIDGLVPSNPSGTDDRSQGDDHIRLIKQVLKNTFPNIDGAVTATEEQLNGVVQRLVPSGIIAMWSGSSASPPTGWKFCNGVGTVTGTGAPVPDLRERFIIAAGGDSGSNYNVGQTGGSANINVTGTTGGTALTEAQIPSHVHTKTYTAVTGGALNLGFVYNNANVYHGGGDVQSASGNPTLTTNPTGGGQAHTHPINTTLTGANIPPYYALAFIIKD